MPGHTGKGADFRLAEMNYEDYPGIYHMVEIEPEDWHLLPDVPPGRDSVNLDADTRGACSRKAGYIIGELQRVIFYDPGRQGHQLERDRAGASAPTGSNADGSTCTTSRRASPRSTGWTRRSPGCAWSSATRSTPSGDLGSGGSASRRQRLPRGREERRGPAGVVRGPPALGGGQPPDRLSMVRKVGGFTFQELNLTIDDIARDLEAGADLSYDFINRPAYQHALADQDTEFLRLTLNASLEFGVAPTRLVHALQNHDELTYELVHFATRHKRRGVQLPRRDDRRARRWPRRSAPR